MATIESVSTTVERPWCRVRDRRGATGSGVVPRSLQRADAGGVSPRPPRLLPVGAGQRPRGAGGDTSTPRDVPSVDERSRACCFDDRPWSLDGVWLLSIRSHRRKDRHQPGAVRSSSPGTPDRCTRPGPLGARCVPVQRGAVRPRPRGVDGVAWSQWSPRERSMQPLALRGAFEDRVDHPATPGAFRAVLPGPSVRSSRPCRTPAAAE